MAVQDKVLRKMHLMQLRNSQFLSLKRHHGSFDRFFFSSMESFFFSFGGGRRGEEGGGGGRGGI